MARPEYRISISSARSRVAPPAAANIALISSRASGIVGRASFLGGLSFAAGDFWGPARVDREIEEALQQCQAAIGGSPGLISHDERHARSAAGVDLGDLAHAVLLREVAQLAEHGLVVVECGGSQVPRPAILEKR